MGNKNTQEDEKLKAKTSAELLDYLASNYITSASFKSLKKLNKKEYCDKMIVLTSDILNKYFNTVDISYISNRIKSGTNTETDNKNDKVYVLPTDDLSQINKADEKEKVCTDIAKFYITIAHVFAAIMTTMNPMVEFTDPNTNQVRQIPVSDKDEFVPDSVAYEIVHKTSLCDRRIKSLKRGHGDVSSDPNQETINVHPQVCDINVNKNTGETKNLEDEPGIPEFLRLYFDKYNPLTGEFDDMTGDTKAIFNEDLQIFYEVFTGNKTMPNYITKFSDIKLRDYHNKPNCQGPDPLWNKHVRGTVSQKLFKQYADNLTQMISNANKNQEALMDILTQLFGYTIDDKGTKNVRVNSKLTDTDMHKIVLKCHELISKLTLQCEVDFTNGVKIYEAIIESKLFETVQNQIKNIDENILNSSSDVAIPELEQPPQIDIQPPQIDVQPPQMDIQPPQMDIQPEQIDVQPPQMDIQPPQMDIQPEQIDVQPPQMDIQLEQIDVQPPQMDIQPEQIDVQPPQMDIQPEQIDVQPKVILAP